MFSPFFPLSAGKIFTRRFGLPCLFTASFSPAAGEAGQNTVKSMTKANYDQSYPALAFVPGGCGQPNSPGLPFLLFHDMIICKHPPILSGLTQEGIKLVKRLLVLSASIGAGHLKPRRPYVGALKTVTRRKTLSMSILKYCDPVVSKILEESYYFSPAGWPGSTGSYTKRRSAVGTVGQKEQLLLALGKYKKFLDEYRPDLVSVPTFSLRRWSLIITPNIPCRTGSSLRITPVTRCGSIPMSAGILWPARKWLMNSGHMELTRKR